MTRPSFNRLIAALFPQDVVDLTGDRPSAGTRSRLLATLWRFSVMGTMLLRCGGELQGGCCLCQTDCELAGSVWHCLSLRLFSHPYGDIGQWNGLRCARDVVWVACGNF